MPGKVLLFLFWILIQLPIILAISFGPKIFKLENFGTCPDGGNELPARFLDINVTTPRINHYIINSIIEMTEDVNYDYSMSMDVKRCTLDRTHCEDYDHLTITNMCSKMRDVKAFWGPMVTTIHPPLNCPVKKGIYRMVNSTVNLSPVNRLPLDGYRWITKFTCHPEGQRNKPNVCVEVEVSITNQKRRKPNQKNQN